jgi:hypothetical protein
MVIDSHQGKKRDRASWLGMHIWASTLLPVVRRSGLSNSNTLNNFRWSY